MSHLASSGGAPKDYRKGKVFKGRELVEKKEIIRKETIVLGKVALLRGMAGVYQ